MHDTLKSELLKITCFNDLFYLCYRIEKKIMNELYASRYVNISNH